MSKMHLLWPGERFVALAAAETADLWAEVVQPRLDASQGALLTAAPAPCLGGCAALPSALAPLPSYSAHPLDKCLPCWSKNCEQMGKCLRCWSKNCEQMGKACWACRPADGGAFEAPHGRPDWALSAPSTAHGAPINLRNGSTAGVRPRQVADPKSVPGQFAANAPEILAVRAALARGSAKGSIDNPDSPESGLQLDAEALAVLRALQPDSAAASVERPAGLGSGSGLRLDAEALAVLRSLQPDAAAELELAAHGAQTGASGVNSPAGTEQSKGRGGRRLAAAAAGEGSGLGSGLGSLSAARARAAVVAAWWREVSAGQAMAPRQEIEPDQAPADPGHRPGPASTRSAPVLAAASAAGSEAVAAEERRFREAATAAGAALPSTFAADFDEVPPLLRACQGWCTCRTSWSSAGAPSAWQSAVMVFVRSLARGGTSELCFLGVLLGYGLPGASAASFGFVRFESRINAPC